MQLRIAAYELPAQRGDRVDNRERQLAGARVADGGTGRITAKHVVISVLFSATLAIGAMVCGICDIAMSGGLSWSRIPMVSIAFAWVVLFPSVMLGARGLATSLILLSVAVVPYLYLLSRFVHEEQVFQLGAMVSAIALVYLWTIYVIFLRVGKTRICAALGMTVLLAVVLVGVVNVLLSAVLKTPVCDIWDMMSMLILLILAIACFIGDYAKNRGLLTRGARRSQ